MNWCCVPAGTTTTSEALTAWDPDQSHFGVNGGLRTAYLVLASHSGLALTAGEDQDLVHGVHFVANVSAYWDLHGDELAVQAGVQHLSELAEGSHF